MTVFIHLQDVFSKHFWSSYKSRPWHCRCPSYSRAPTSSPPPLSARSEISELITLRHPSDKIPPSTSLLGTNTLFHWHQLSFNLLSPFTFPSLSRTNDPPWLRNTTSSTLIRDLVRKNHDGSSAGSSFVNAFSTTRYWRRRANCS